MNKKSYFLALFLLFLLGTGFVLVFRAWQVKKLESVPFSPQQSSFVSKPPSDALKGKLVKAKGKVEKEPRGKDEFEEIDIENEILQREKLAAGEKSQATVEFLDFVEIDLASNSEINFISLIPTNFLIEQKSGEINYKLLQDNRSVSVRSLHALLVFYSGEGRVAIDDQEIIIKILSGKAKLSLVDLENETHVWELEKGQRILIDDAERRVEIK